MPEEHLKKAVQQPNASSFNSKANEQKEQISARIDIEYISNLPSGSFFVSDHNFDNQVSQYSPGVEEAVT